MQNTTNFANKSNYKCGSNNLDLLPFYVQSINIPGINFNLPELGSRGGAKMSLSGDNLDFGNLSMEIIVDENYNVYTDILDIIFKLVDTSNAEFKDYSFDFWCQITDSLGKDILKIEYTNCRIESVGELGLDTLDDTEITFSLDLKYDYYNIIRSGDVPSLVV